MNDDKIDLQRHIMSYQGQKDGVSFIVLAGIHGNEPAGIIALSLVKKMLDVEPITNPGFVFSGNMLGIIGNLSACRDGVRYHDRDLNRMWQEDIITEEELLPAEEQSKELNELKEILQSVHGFVQATNPKKLYILDLHTTSSGGGIFAIPSQDPESIKVASELHTPVILDIMRGIQGTTLHYFTRDVFPGVETVTLTFEGGQHNDPLSVNRCIAAIVNCLISIGAVKSEDVENIHNQILIDYAKDLPKVSKLIYKHNITDVDQFVMNPGYSNFDDIDKGEKLAMDKNGDVLAPYSGKILMPLYQSKGEEGFYIVESCD